MRSTLRTDPARSSGFLGATRDDSDAALSCFDLNTHVADPLGKSPVTSRSRRSVNGSPHAVGQRGCRKTLEIPFGLCLPARPRCCRTDDRRIGHPPSIAVQRQEPKFRQRPMHRKQEFLRFTFDVLSIAPTFLWLLSSSKDHGGTGRFARRGIFSGDDLSGVGTDQAVSKARLTIVRLERQKPCCRRCRDLSLAAALYQSAMRRWVPSSGPHLTGSVTKTSSHRAQWSPQRGVPRS